MIEEIFTNKWFIYIAVGSIVALAYTFLNKKDKNLEVLEREYNELLNADQYKVKGQF